MLIPPEILAQVEDTRSRLEAHRQMPALKRLGNRVLHHYPSFSDRELLRRVDIGQYPRVSENIVRAIDETAAARDSFTPYLYAKKRNLGTTSFYSFVLDVHRSGLDYDLLADVAATEGVALPTGYLRAGVYKTVASKDVYDSPTAQGIYICAGSTGSETRLPLTPDTFDTFSEQYCDSIELFTGKVALFCQTQAQLRPLNT